MSFCDVVSAYAARLFSPGNTGAARGPQESFSPWASWAARRREREAAEKDRATATQLRDIDHSYRIAAYNKDLDTLAALMRHEDRQGSRGQGRELALLNLCYPTYDRVANDLGAHGFVWEDNLPAVDLLLPRCDLDAALTGGRLLKPGREDTALSRVGERNPTAAAYLQEHRPEPERPSKALAHR